MKAIVLFSLLWLAATGTSACDTATELGRETQPQGLRSIQSLKALCTADYAPVTEDISIRGLVVGNDHYGEFAKTLVVQDASGGITIAADQTQLYRSFPFGCEVTIACNGLTLAQYGGKIVLGAAPDGKYGVTRIPGSEIARYIRVNAPGGIGEIAPIAFEAIGPQHTDTFVRFDGIRFTEARSWCDLDDEMRPVTTEHTITDAAGHHSFVVRVTASCTYAKEPVPQGTGSLFGVIDYFAGKYSLRISNRSITAAEGHPTAYP